MLKQASRTLPAHSGRVPCLPERYYGDGPPNWCIGKNKAPAETAAEAHQAWETAIRRLRNQAEKEAEAERRALIEHIAEIVEGCYSAGRCGHPACPMCMRAQQRWFVDAAQAAVSRKFGDAPLAAASIIPKLRLKPGSSIAHMSEQLTRIVTALNRGIQAAGIEFLIGAIDISLNRAARRQGKAPGVKVELSRAAAQGCAGLRRAEPHDGGAGGEARFQLHLWGIGSRAELDRAKPALQVAFGRTKTIHKSVKIYDFNDDNAGYAYAYKTRFNQRTAYMDERKKSQMDENGNLTWEVVGEMRNTRADDLTVAQHVEVMHLLHLLGFDRRLFLTGAKRCFAGAKGKAGTNDKNGEPVIEPQFTS